MVGRLNMRSDEPAQEVRTEDEIHYSHRNQKSLSSSGPLMATRRLRTLFEQCRSVCVALQNLISGHEIQYFHHNQNLSVHGKTSAVELRRNAFTVVPPDRPLARDLQKHSCCFRSFVAKRLRSVAHQKRGLVIPWACAFASIEPD